jgi:hypothetical protein
MLQPDANIARQVNLPNRPISAKSSIALAPSVSIIIFSLHTFNFALLPLHFQLYTFNFYTPYPLLNSKSTFLGNKNSNFPTPNRQLKKVFSSRRHLSTSGGFIPHSLGEACPP